MKKTTKLFAGVALAAMLLTTGCNSNSNNNQPGNFRQQDIYQLYKVAGGTMSYQEWLDTIRGADGSQFYADGVDPNDASGKDGDVFVNIASWNFFLKIGGHWQSLGCLKGAQGEQGPQGPKGDQGEQGPKGDPGSQIYADGSDPKANSGAEGDVFFNIATWDVFMKLNGAWVKIGNIKGADGLNGKDGQNGQDGLNGQDGVNGKNGAQIYADAVDPDDNGGFDGDVFFNIVSWDVFMKFDGKWQKVGNIKGKDGVDGKDGASVLYGYGYPSNDLGKDGDSYIDLNNFNFYGKFEGYWVKLANIRQNEDRWGPDIETEMWNYIGESLPYAEFDQASLSHGYDEDYHEYIINDDNENNVLENYNWKLLDAGWSYDEEEELYFKETRLGKMRVAYDWFEATSSAAAGNQIEVILPYNEAYWLANGFTKNEGWPAEVVELAFLEENVFGPINENGVWYTYYKTNEYSDDTMKTSGYLVTEGDFSAEAEDALFAAGFIWEDNYEDYELPDDWMTYLYVDVMRDYTVIQFYGSYKPIPVEPHTAQEASAAIVDFYANQDMEVEVPEYAVASDEAYFGIKEQPAVDALEVDVYGSDHDEMFDFALEMEVAGWTVAEGEDEGDYVAKMVFDDGSFAQIDIQDWIDYSYGCIRLICTYGAPAEFPSEEIAEYLASKGVTDVIPAFSGIALDYAFVTQGGLQLQFKVESGAEAATVTQYQADLLAANYTEAGADTYGDMHYASPNGQLDLCAWNGLDINRAGMVYVDIQINVAQDWTALTAITEVLNHLGKTPTDLSEQAGYPYYSFGGAYYAESNPASTVKGLLAGWTPTGFELAQDWTAGHSDTGSFADQTQGYDYESCTYVFNNKVILMYRVSTQDYSGTAITVIQIIAAQPNG